MILPFHSFHGQSSSSDFLTSFFFGESSDHRIRFLPTSHSSPSSSYLHGRRRRRHPITHTFCLFFEPCHSCLQLIFVVFLFVVSNSLLCFLLRFQSLVESQFSTCQCSCLLSHLMLDSCFCSLANLDLIAGNSHLCSLIISVAASDSAALYFCREVVRLCLATLCFCREVLCVIVISCVVIATVFQSFILHLSPSDLHRHPLSLSCLSCSSIFFYSRLPFLQFDSLWLSALFFCSLRALKFLNSITAGSTWSDCLAISTSPSCSFLVVSPFLFHCSSWKVFSTLRICAVSGGVRCVISSSCFTRLMNMSCNASLSEELVVSSLCCVHDADNVFCLIDPGVMIFPS